VSGLFGVVLLWFFQLLVYLIPLKWKIRLLFYGRDGLPTRFSAWAYARRSQYEKVIGRP